MTDHVPTRTASPLLEICRSPAGQGVLTAVSGLIPVRRYPRWLRETIVWAPSITMVGVFLCPEQAQRLVRRAGMEVAAPSDRPRAETDAEGEPETDAEAPLTARLAAAGFFGAAVYGVMRTSLWADTALESGLRRLRVPAPRVVLAAAAGTAAWGSAERERRRGSSQSS